MSSPKITVYIPSHNYGRFLEESIESVLRQSIESWELLVIDDNSSDNTSEVMARYRGDMRLRLFSTSGIGLPSVCNLALRESRGEYIIRLDGDDIFDDNILLVLSNYLDRNSECAMVFPDNYFIDEYGEIFARERREKIYVKNHLLDMPANGACCMIRKVVLEKLGGYREDLGAQDGYDLWMKLKEEYKVANVNLPLFYYRRHSGNLTNNHQHLVAIRQKIKIDNIVDKLEKYRPIIAVIPCRKNYDFCQDLWSQEINGKSLLQRDIEKCSRSQVLDYIVVASDNTDVQGVISLFDDPRIGFYHRRTENTITSRGLAATIEKIAAPMDKEWRGLSVISYYQAPFVTTETFEEAICTLILNDVDCAFGVEEIREPLFTRTAHGIQPVNPSRGFSTDFDIIYRQANTSLATKNRNLKVGSLTGPSIISIVVPGEECLFIDSPQKLKIAETIMGDR